MSEQNLPWRAFTAGGVGQTIEDSEGRSVCFGFGDRPELAEVIVSACNTRDELLAACKAAMYELAALTPDPPNAGASSSVEQWPGCENPADRECLRKAYDQLTAAIAAAEGRE